MPPLQYILINSISLVVLPLSDLAISLTAGSLALIFINTINLIQSYIYITSHYHTSSNGNNSTHSYIFYLACLSMLIYSLSLVIQIYNYNFKLHYYDVAVTQTTLPQQLSTSSLIQPSTQSSMINHFTNSVTNSITNSLNLSPAVTNLSRKSNEVLVFKIDDILSPYIPSVQKRTQPEISHIESIQDISNIPQFNLQQDHINFQQMKEKEKLRSFKATPILATLLALSAAPSPANAAPVVPQLTTNSDYNGFCILLNFLLSVVCNLLNLNFALNISPLYLFKTSLNALNWILISIFKHPGPSLKKPSFDEIIPLFDNKLMIYTNTLIVLISIGISLFTLHATATVQNMKDQSDTKSDTTNSVPNYNTF